MTDLILGELEIGQKYILGAAKIKSICCRISCDGFVSFYTEDNNLHFELCISVINLIGIKKHEESKSE